MPSRAIVVVDRESRALSYVLDFVFDQFLGIGYELKKSLSNPDSSSLLFNYSDRNIGGAITIIPKNYLFKNDLREYPFPEIVYWHGLPVFYETAGDIPFDIFSAIFFLLTRAEEYGITDLDQHERFSGHNSIFHKTAIAGRPIIDEWLIELQKEILKKNPVQKFKERKFNWTNTFDIDIAYAHLHRNFYRLLGGSLKKALFRRYEKRAGTSRCDIAKEKRSLRYV